MKKASCMILMLIGLLIFAPQIHADDSPTKGKAPKELTREKLAFTAS